MHKNALNRAAESWQNQTTALWHGNSNPTGSSMSTAPNYHKNM